VRTRHEGRQARRLPSTPRAVLDTRLAEINQIAATTGNDPALDALLLRLHTETALSEVVPELVELEVAVPHLKPASR
jgi:hypothetical protein